MCFIAALSLFHGGIPYRAKAPCGLISFAFFHHELYLLRTCHLTHVLFALELSGNKPIHQQQVIICLIPSVGVRERAPCSGRNSVNMVFPTSPNTSSQSRWATTSTSLPTHPSTRVCHTSTTMAAPALSSM